MDNLPFLPGRETDPLQPAPANAELILLFDRFALPVYRFHLLMSGDPAAAETRTAQTFLTARRRLADRRKPWTSLETLFWRVALGTGRSQVTGKARELASAQPAAGPEVEFSEAEPDSLRMQRALIPPLSQALDRMPLREAQLVGLLLFCDLSARQAAEITGSTPDSVDLRLGRALLRLAGLLDSGFEDGGASARSLPDDLRELSDRFHPDQRFLRSLRAELDRPEPPSPRAFSAPFFAGKPLRRVVWVPLAAVGIIVFAASIWSLPSRAPAVPSPQPTLAVVTLPTVNPIPITSSGFLTPVSAQACSQARQQVEASLHIHTQIVQDAQFTDPIFENQDQNGFGCEILGTARGDVLKDPDSVIQVLLPVLNGMGYQEDGQFGSSSTCPDCNQFPQDWSGTGVRLSKNDGRALLAVGWRPADASLCAAGSTPTTCALPPEENVLSVRLVMADDPIRKTLSAFISRWQSGDQNALDLVSGDMQKRLASLADLDALVGVQQSQVARAQVSWQGWPRGLETIQMLVVILATPAPTDNSVEPFIRLHVLLRQENDAWRIDNIWRAGYSQAGGAAFIDRPGG